MRPGFTAGRTRCYARRLCLSNKRALALAGLAMLVACTAPTREAEAGEGREAKPPMRASAPSRAASPPAPERPQQIVITGGEMEQGGWLRGQLPAGTVAATLGASPLTPDSEGRFFAGFDRDAGGVVVLSARLASGKTLTQPLTVKPRNWRIEHINAARRSGGPSASFMRRRAPELAQIRAARAQNSDSDGWAQSFIWPVEGRISGRFGAQRIYRGEPGSYHTGLDIATGGSGTPFVAPADGVVVLAAQTPFSLEGNLIMIDHGQGLNSAFLHASKIAVKEGDRVKQGQYIGNIGASGRATGPHLHWSIKWRDARLDPLLFVAPQR